MTLIVALGLGGDFILESDVYLLLSHSLVESFAEVSNTRAVLATLSVITQQQRGLLLEPPLPDKLLCLCFKDAWAFSSPQVKLEEVSLGCRF